jgi:hypothetical protein
MEVIVLKSFNLVVLSLLIVSVILMLTGYVQLNNSVLWGAEELSAYMSEIGSMQTEQYNIMLQGFIEQLQWKGGIILSLSGIVFITCVFSLLFKNSSRLN